MWRHFRKRTLIYISISLLIIIYLGLTIQKETLPFIDAWTTPFASSINSDALYYSFFRFFTFLGSRTFLIPFCLLISIPLYHMYKKMIPFIIVSGGTLFTYGLNSFIKWVVQRQRPQIVPELYAEGFSFPSGHAMISFVFYSLLIYFLLKHFTSWGLRLCIWVSGILLIGLIGSSRYILYVHYASDIIAGYLIGSILVILVVRLYETYTKNKQSVDN